MTTINWQQMMANSAKIGEPVPEGDYPAVSEEATFGQSRAGDPQWKITWRLIGGPHNGRRVFDNQTLAQGDDEKAAQRRGFFFRDMKNLGFDDNFFAQMPEGEALAQALLGINAVLTVTINSNNYNNVNGYQRIADPSAAMQQPGFNQPQPAQQMQPQGFQQPQPAPQQAWQQPAAAGFGQPQQGGFQQAPQQQQQFGQPMQPQGGYDPSQQYGQPQGLQQPAQAAPGGFQQPQGQQGLMQPQMPPQQPQAGGLQQPAPQIGPDGQPLQQPQPADPNAQQYTPQPRPPF